MLDLHRAMTGAIAALALAGCAADAPVESEITPEDTFFSHLAELCGQAFAGAMTSADPADEGSAFAAGPLVMHVRDCSEDEIAIPLQVGVDRSRVWVITRTGAGLRLKHRHSHSDGSPDAVTNYGGDSDLAASGPRAQSFPADAESIELFEREGLAASVENVWMVEIEPGETFIYQLTRPNRLFRAEFDLSAPVPAPPPPWAEAPEPTTPEGEPHD